MKSRNTHIENSSEKVEYWVSKTQWFLAQTSVQKYNGHIKCVQTHWKKSTVVVDVTIVLLNAMKS